MKLICTSLVILGVLLCLGAVAYAQDCVFVLGDINGDNDATPFADVVYAVNFFKGLGSPPPDAPNCSYCCANPRCDVNASCSFTAVDLIYLITYWKGGPDMFNSCGLPAPDTVLVPRGTDLGMPDSIIVGNLDGTPILAQPGDMVSIPIWIKNDEAVPAFNISLAIQNVYIANWNGGDILAPLDTWDDLSIKAPEIDRPTAGYTSQSLHGWAYINDPRSPYINTEGTYQQIAAFSVATSSDISLIGQTAQVIPGDHSLVGPIAFTDSAGQNEWMPAVVNGQIHFDWVITHMGVSPTELVDTVVQGYALPTELVISNLGAYRLNYIIQDSVDWISAAPDSGHIFVGHSDTTIITFNSGALGLGTYYSHILINSNDSAQAVTVLPVTLVVQEGVPVGRIAGTVRSTWGHPLPVVEVTLNPGGLIDTTDAYGNYAFGPIDVASYTISFHHPSYYDFSAIIELIPYDTLFFDLALHSPSGVIQVPGQYDAIDAAVTAAADGDTILVGPGSWGAMAWGYKHLTIRSSGGPNVTTALGASGSYYNGPPSIIDGFTFAGEGATGVYALRIGLILRNSIIENIANGRDGGGVKAETCSVVEITGNTFSNNSTPGWASGGAIDSRANQNVTISGNTILGNLAHWAGAIYIGQCPNTIIHHNLVVGNQANIMGSAIYFQSCPGGQVYNNTIVGNIATSAPGYYGTLSFAGCSGFSVFNNIIAQNTSVGLFTDGNQLDVDYNDIWGNTVDYYIQIPGPHDISVDPLFEGGVPYSYHLTSGSPCINTGDPESPLDPDGSQADMGAFYYDMTAPTIEVSPTSYDDTLFIPGPPLVLPLYISNLEGGILYYGLQYDHAMLLLSADTGFVSNTQVDTITVTVSGDGWPMGETTVPITVNSNDPANGTIVVPVTIDVEPFASPCEYTCGDANGNGAFNGLDVTYSVAYFKGGPPPLNTCECPPGSGNVWYIAGDVNGSCSFNGLDVTYMVAYFKGGPVPHSCPDCPPAGLLAPPAPGVEPIPAVQPIPVHNQNAKTKASSVE